MPANEVIPIDEDARYAVIFRNQVLDSEDRERIEALLREWWESGEKFLVVDGNAELVRIVEAKEIENAIPKDSL